MEYIYVGATPERQINNFQEWDLFYKRIPQEVSIPALIINTAVWPVQQLVARTATFYDQLPCINTLDLVADTIKLYRNTMPIKFFNNYTPWQFEGVDTPDDNGAYFIPFSLYANQFQPSGYIQLSKIRNLYLNYTGDISTTDRCVLHVSGIALNFISIDSSGRALLKFAT
jgi:hypothetical protein